VPTGISTYGGPCDGTARVSETEEGINGLILVILISAANEKRCNSCNLIRRLEMEETTKIETSPNAVMQAVYSTSEKLKTSYVSSRTINKLLISLFLVFSLFQKCADEEDARKCSNECYKTYEQCKQNCSTTYSDTSNPKYIKCMEDCETQRKECLVYCGI